MAATTPEMPNEKPELPGQGSPEAQALQQMQVDTQFNPVNAGDLDNAFANKSDDASNIFGDVKISDSTKSSDRTAIKDDIASMTTQELETAIKEQRNYVNGIENQIASVSRASDAAGIKQQADKLAEADAYFAR